MPSSMELQQEWELPLQSPWRPFYKYTLFSVLDDHAVTSQLPAVRELEVVQKAERAAVRLAQGGLDPHTMWVVDLRGAASVAFGTALARSAPAQLVLTFNNWPGDNEVVPAEETLAALVTMRPTLDPSQLKAPPVFLLDSWRLAYRDEPIEDGAFDNRYLLTSADLPSADLLARNDIRDVVYVVDADRREPLEEDDLNQPFLDYQRAGVRLSIVDLDEAVAEDAPAPLQIIISGRYTCTARSTVLTAPDAFFRRSRGGFGGPVAVPAPLGTRHTIGGSGGFGFGGFGG
jgi:hypothetical protein